jgi:aryl-alcohol dehydrogenase-like predicted oxidoreductase
VYGLGHAEEVVSRAIGPWRVGEDVCVFTKCGQNWRDAPPGGLVRDLRPASIRFECEQSLRRLRVDRIDLYQFHWPDNWSGTPVEESWGTMVELINEGKVRWGGVSNFDVGLLTRCESIRHVDSLQTPLNFLNRSACADVIPWCLSTGVGVIVYAPMATGLLTGALDRDRVSQLAKDDGRWRLARFREPQLSNALDLVARLRPIADQLGIGLPALAVAWTLAVPGVTGTIAGARQPDQVDGWLPAADLDLTGDVLARIGEAIAQTGV